MTNEQERASEMNRQRGEKQTNEWNDMYTRQAEPLVYRDWVTVIRSVLLQRINADELLSKAMTPAPERSGPVPD